MLPVEMRQACFHGAQRDTQSRSLLAACSSAHPHMRLVACTHGSSFSAEAKGIHRRGTEIETGLPAKWASRQEAQIGEFNHFITH
jgi:hypothetical protein